MASLEFAPFLHPYLGELFKLQPSESTYYAEYPWRGLSYESSQIWREKLADPQTSEDERQKIFSCLLQTREPRNVKFACEFALAEDFFDRPCDLLEYIIGYWLEAVGFTFERAKFYADGATQATGDEILKMDADECGGARQAQASKILKRAQSNMTLNLTQTKPTPINHKKRRTMKFALAARNSGSKDTAASAYIT